MDPRLRPYIPYLLGTLAVVVVVVVGVVLTRRHPSPGPGPGPGPSTGPKGDTSGGGGGSDEVITADNFRPATYAEEGGLCANTACGKEDGTCPEGFKGIGCQYQGPEVCKKEGRRSGCVPDL